MSKLAKQSIQTTIFSYVGVVLGYLNVLWLYPYALDATELGTFRTIQDLGLLLVPFAQLGIGHGITRFFPQLENQKSAFLSYSLAFSVLGFLMVTVVFFGFKDQIIGLFASNSPEVINFLGVALLVTLFALLGSVLDAYSRSYLKVAIPTFFREVFLRFLTSVLVAMYLMGWIDFEDKCMNKIIFLCQCACGKEYESKQHDTKRFQNYYRFYKTKPQHTIFLPYSLINTNANKFYHSDLIENEYLVFERKRILEYHNDLNFINSESFKIVEKFINYHNGLN
ncbi:MAG: hypothetical protein B7Z16_09045 [Algoriphagus sp. 32-45-6]|nr:MAG: hypothetical protein B7Z16_09045 [Algoriphagus sp. 32-45-6]